MVKGRVQRAGSFAALFNSGIGPLMTNERPFFKPSIHAA
jgi:hypothetical protein